MLKEALLSFHFSGNFIGALQSCRSSGNVEDALLWNVEDALLWSVEDALLWNDEDALLWSDKDALLSCQSISLLAWAGGDDIPAAGPVLPTH